MLFRCCTSRLGKARSHPLSGSDPLSWRNEGDVSIDRSPEVLDLAIQLLDPLCFSHAALDRDADSGPDRDGWLSEGPAPRVVATERAFAALDLLGRITTLQEDWSRIKPLLLEQMGSSVWQLRAQAARVFASSIAPCNSMDAIESLIDDVSVHRSQNKIHGQFLCVREILRKSWQTIETNPTACLEHFTVVSSTLSSIEERYYMSPVVRSLFEEIQNDVLESEIAMSHAANWPSELAILDLRAAGDGNAIDKVRSNDPPYPICQSIALQDVYNMFNGQRSPTSSEYRMVTFRQCFDILARDDADSAVFLIRRLSSQSSWNLSIRQALNELLVDIIANDYPDDFKVEAMGGLVTLMEHKHFSHDRCSEVAKISQFLLSDIQYDSRELFVAKLRLQANLLAITHKETPPIVCMGQRSMLCRWTSMLQEAAADDNVSITVSSRPSAQPGL